MALKVPDNNLANYRAFLERLDELCSRITAKSAGVIRCQPGCSSCCRHLGLFPVEAASLVNAVRQLPAETRVLLAGRAAWGEDAGCPLLVEDRCLVYVDRPVICRTHGLPLLTEIDGAKRIDFCPQNFRGVTSLSGEMVIDLETVNRTLVAINRQFEQHTSRAADNGERLTIAEIITIALMSERNDDEPA